MSWIPEVLTEGKLAPFTFFRGKGSLVVVRMPGSLPWSLGRWEAKQRVPKAEMLALAVVSLALPKGNREKIPGRGRAAAWTPQELLLDETPCARVCGPALPLPFPIFPPDLLLLLQRQLWKAKTRAAK